MTLTATTNKVAYSGDGSTTSFPVTFIYWEDTTVKVILSNNTTGVETVWTAGTQYNLTGGDGAVGTLAIDTSPTDYTPASGETLTIKSNHPVTQTTALPLGGAFPSTTMEDRMDKNVRLVQQVQEELDRAVKFPESSATTGVSITDLTASQLLRVNAAADGIENVSMTDLAMGIFRGNWAASTAYAVRDIVKDTSNNNIYIVLTAHTSSGAQPISSNTDVAKWALLVDAAAAAASAAAASTSASNAATSASNASTSAGTASTQASAASTSAGTASTQASAASTSAGTASTQATASSNSAAASAASYDSFDDRFLGAKTSDPSVDNDGDTLIDGALFFRTDQAVMKVYKLSTTTWLNTTPSSANQGHINTVSGIASDVTAVAGKATEVGRLGTAAAVADMAILGTSDVVTDMNVLGTAAIIADMAILGTSAIVADMAILGTSDVVADMNVLATSDVVVDMNVLGTSANVTAMNTLGTSANVTAMSTVSGAIANVNTTASNIASVNNFAEVYRIAGADPGSSLTEGDLVFRTDTDTMRVYNGSAWQNVAPIATAMAFGTVSVAGQSNVVADSTSDTMTLVGSGGTSITTNAGTDTVTISSTAGASVGLVLALG